MSLDVISVNIWQILISLCNLLILFLILKRFLYKPVRKMVAQRQADIDEKYDAASKAQKEAEDEKKAYEEKLRQANTRADEIIKTATDDARRRSGEILAQAKERADGVLSQAQQELELEKKKAQSDIRKEIVDISTLLTGKMLEREIDEKDHRVLIDSFLREVGEASESDK